MRKFLQNIYFNIGSIILSKGVSILNKIPFFKKRVSYMVKQTIVAIIFDNMLFMVVTTIFIIVANIVIENFNILKSVYFIASIMAVYWIIAFKILWNRLKKYNLSSMELE